MIQALRTARTAGALDRLAALAGSDDAEPDLDQLRFATARLHTAIQDELQELASELPGGIVSLRIDLTPSAAGESDRPPPMSVAASGPDRAGDASTTIEVTRRPGGDWPLQVVAEGPHHQATVAPLRVRLDNLYPALTAVTRQRVREWARQVVNTLAAELLAGATGPGGERRRAA